MADVKWTNEQLDAIRIRNSKTLVAAGAGSGKTAVLVERIIRKIIDDKIDIDKMLIVTFTNAAASEMKERIRNRLYEEVNNNHSLQKQILYLNRSSIMTIDAFCKKAIKDYFYKLDIDPNFKIGDNTECELMKLEAIEEVLEELYESDNEDIQDVLDAYSSNKSDESLINLVLSIHRFIQSSQKPMEWLDEKCEMYNTSESDFSNTIWGKRIIHYAREVIEEIVDELKRVYEELLGIADAENYMLTIQDDILKLEALRKNNLTWDDYYNEFKNVEFTSLKRAPKLDDSTKEYVKSVREKMKNIIGKYLRDEVFISSSNEILEDIKLAYKHASALKNIVELFDKRFKEKKSDKNILDFSDIEHLCLKLFEENEDVLKDYKEKYEEILIDEYQDSNLIQEAILTKIANKNVFMVGDVKQSIYKFRQARPELFLSKYSSYNTFTSNDNATLPENKILLFKNFRSNENIINQVNFIFKNIMFKETGEIDYTEEEYLKYGATYYGYEGDPAEIHIIEKNADVTDKENEVIIDGIEEKPQLEARVVANRIEELVGNFEVFDKNTKEKRKARYSDIVILLRATKGYADVFMEELSARNIPAYADIRTGYFDNTEVQIILSLLKIIDNPYQDIPLLAVLRSPIGNFDVNELTKIRLYNKKCNFYDAMLLASGNGDEKVKAFIDKLNSWREKSRYFLVDELISYIYDDTGYYHYVSLLPNGDLRQANLKLLLKKATEFNKSTYNGLYNFLIFIDNLKESSGDFDSPSEISETADVVRIMSIHKSKGLEFPIVILSGTTRKFNKKDLQNKVILHQDLGLGFDIINTNKRLSYESIPKLALKLKCEEEMIAEEMRILYVALTRAKEKIIVTALTPNIENKIDTWNVPISMYAIKNSNCFADWVCKVVLSTKNDWDIHEWKYNDVLKLSNDEENELSKHEVKNINDDEIYKLISSRFNWKYTYTLSTKIPSKISVSELKRLHSLEDYSQISKVKDVETPKFIEDISIHGAEYGTLLHSKLEKLDFKDFDTNILLEDIADNRLKNKLKKDILSFSNTSLFKRIQNCLKIFKETPFNLSISAKSIFPFENESKDDEIMIQGIIDLFFEDEEGIVIVDYKSDKINNENELISKYIKQLEYYKMALEKITCKKVVGTYIYSFYLQKEIKV